MWPWAGQKLGEIGGRLGCENVPKHKKGQEVGIKYCEGRQSQN